jgi:Fe-S-cluster containining protein
MHTSDIQGVFDAFLAALGDPEGGAAFYEMHSADALLRSAGEIQPAAATDRDSFARAHRELSLQGRNVLPNFRSGALLGAPTDAHKSDPHTSETVAWFEVIEMREQRPLVAALGLQTHSDVTRVGWCTLAPRLEKWSYRDGLLRSIADYGWMRTPEPARARALLDASYFRQHWRSPVKFDTLPDARFSCQMSTDCCRHDFEITLPPEAQRLIDAMPWESVRPELAGTQLPVRPDGKLQLKSLNETCRFLGARSQCLIHQTLGRQPFGPCSVFPFAFAGTPEGVAVSMSPICGAARRGVGLGLAAREADLRERLVQAEPRQPDGFRLAPELSIAWEQFRNIERTLCEILAAPELPLRRRLYLGTRLLGALTNNEAVDMKGWLSEPPLVITAELRTALRGMLTKVLSWDRATLKALPQDIPAELATLEIREHAVVVRILQNTLFCKAYSYPFDLTTAFNFLIVLYLLALLMQEASQGALTEAMWRELGSLGVHGLLKSVLHEGVPEGFRTVLGTADFGQWLLVA